MPGKPTLSEEQLRSRAKKYLDSKKCESPFFDQTAEKRVPRFEPREVEPGTFLGAGGFCTVVEVQEVQLKSEALHEEKDKEDEGVTRVLQNRSFIANHVFRDGQARYAVKQLSPILFEKDHRTFLSGIVDLAMEVKFLSVLQHPHIIKMRGRSSTHPCSDSFFIVLDRLHETLTERLETWRKDVKKLTGLSAIRDIRNEKKNELLGQRLSTAHDICSALAYMHGNRVVYRDLKPDNIGFDIRGDVKIFDFGLAKVMEAKDKVRRTDCFKLTKRCGSPRYMAPEVFMGYPYNEGCDVYSFGLILWQIVQLKKPFKDHNYEMIEEQVVRGNERPQFDPRKTPSSLQNLIERCWSKELHIRPECQIILEEIKDELMRMCGAESVDALDISNRTEASVRAQG